MKPQAENHAGPLLSLPRPHILSLPTFIGLALMAIGIMVISGWLLQVRIMVEFRAGLVAMVFNTALCFALVGFALALPGLLRRQLIAFQSLIGIFVFCLCGLVLIEHWLDLTLGIDLGYLHTWLRDGNTRPGRLAPNTALGFMIAGMTLILMPRIANKGRELLCQTLIYSLLAVGLTGLIGYVISPDQLFGWARSARMAIPTALGMIMISIALLSSLHLQNAGNATKFFRMDEKIGFMSAAILCVVTLSAGLTGFVFQQSILENSLRDKLQFRLDGERGLIQAALKEAFTKTSHAGSDPHLVEPAFRFVGNPDNVSAITEFSLELEGLISDGFRGALLSTLDGKLLQQVGVVDDYSETEFSLPRDPGEFATLAWDGELVLRTDVPLLNNGVAFARLKLTQRLPVVQAQLFGLGGLGESGEIALCGSHTEKTLICFPTGRQSASFVIDRFNVAGKPLPMSFAVDGKVGLIAALDYKGHNVMAAYGPLATNLGLVVKQDTAELYSVIRTQLLFTIPALLFLIALGAVFMRSQIKPLATRLILSENHAREQQLEMNTIVASVGEGIMTVNEEGLIESFNAAAAQIFGYGLDEVIGQPLQMLMPQEMRERHEAGMQRYLSTGQGEIIGRPKLELPGLRKDGTLITLELTINEISFESRRLFVGVVRDITERKQFEEKLIFLAQYDLVTGLPNRALFMDRLSGAIMRASRSRSALAVMFLDLDGFKNINDTLGHHSGDDLLKKFGDRLCMAVRKSDSVARLAGDEFTIILEGLSDPENDTRAVAEKIIAAMQSHFELGEHQIKITTSIGVAIHAEGKADLEDLLRRADEAMYRAKHSGRNRWSI